MDNDLETKPDVAVSADMPDVADDVTEPANGVADGHAEKLGEKVIDIAAAPQEHPDALANDKLSSLKAQATDAPEEVMESPDVSAVEGGKVPASKMANGVKGHGTSAVGDDIPRGSAATANGTADDVAVVHALRAELSSAVQARDAAVSDVNALRTELHAAQQAAQDAAKAVADVEATEADVGRLRAELDSAKEAKEAAESDVGSLRVELEAANKARADAEARVVELESELQRFKDEHAFTAAAKEAVESQLREQVSKREQAEEKVELLRGQVEAARRTVMQLQKQEQERANRRSSQAPSTVDGTSEEEERRSKRASLYGSVRARPMSTQSSAATVASESDAPSSSSGLRELRLGSGHVRGQSIAYNKSPLADRTVPLPKSPMSQPADRRLGIPSQSPPPNERKPSVSSQRSDSGDMLQISSSPSMASSIVHVSTTSEPDSNFQAELQSHKDEAAALRAQVEVLTIKLMESEEARDASETCLRSLREFMAGGDSADGDGMQGLKLPPLPTEDEPEDDPPPPEPEPVVAQPEQTSRWGFRLWRGGEAAPEAENASPSPSVALAAPVVASLERTISSTPSLPPPMVTSSASIEAPAPSPPLNHSPPSSPPPQPPLSSFPADSSPVLERETPPSPTFHEREASPPPPPESVPPQTLVPPTPAPQVPAPPPPPPRRRTNHASANAGGDTTDVALTPKEPVPSPPSVPTPLPAVAAAIPPPPPPRAPRRQPSRVRIPQRSHTTPLPSATTPDDSAMSQQKPGRFGFMSNWRSTPPPAEPEIDPDQPLNPDGANLDRALTSFFVRAKRLKKQPPRPLALDNISALNQTRAADAQEQGVRDGSAVGRRSHTSRLSAGTLSTPSSLTSDAEATPVVHHFEEKPLSRAATAAFRPVARAPRSPSSSSRSSSPIRTPTPPPRTPSPTADTQSTLPVHAARARSPDVGDHPPAPFDPSSGSAVAARSPLPATSASTPFTTSRIASPPSPMGPSLPSIARSPSPRPRSPSPVPVNDPVFAQPNPDRRTEAAEPAQPALDQGNVRSHPADRSPMSYSGDWESKDREAKVPSVPGSAVQSPADHSDTPVVPTPLAFPKRFMMDASDPDRTTTPETLRNGPKDPIASSMGQRGFTSEHTVPRAVEAPPVASSHPPALADLKRVPTIETQLPVQVQPPASTRPLAPLKVKHLASGPNASPELLLSPDSPRGSTHSPTSPSGSIMDRPRPRRKPSHEFGANLARVRSPLSPLSPTNSSGFSSPVRAEYNADRAPRFAAYNASHNFDDRSSRGTLSPNVSTERLTRVDNTASPRMNSVEAPWRSASVDAPSPPLSMRDAAHLHEPRRGSSLSDVSSPVMVSRVTPSPTHRTGLGISPRLDSMHSSAALARTVSPVAWLPESVTGPAPMHQDQPKDDQHDGSTSIGHLFRSMGMSYSSHESTGHGPEQEEYLDEVRGRSATHVESPKLQEQQPSDRPVRPPRRSTIVGSDATPRVAPSVPVNPPFGVLSAAPPTSMTHAPPPVLSHSRQLSAAEPFAHAMMIQAASWAPLSPKRPPIDPTPASPFAGALTPASPSTASNVPGLSTTNNSPSTASTFSRSYNIGDHLPTPAHLMRPSNVPGHHDMLGAPWGRGRPPSIMSMSSDSDDGNGLSRIGMNLQALNLTQLPGNTRLNSDMNVNTAGLTRQETKKLSRERRASFGTERQMYDAPPTDFMALAHAYGLNKPPMQQQQQQQVPPSPATASRGVRLSDDGPMPLPNVAATPTRGVRLSDDGPIPPPGVSRGVRLTDNPVPPIQVSRPADNPIPVPPRSALRPASQAISRGDSTGSFERLRYSTTSTETDEHSDYVLPPRMRALEPPIPARALNTPQPPLPLPLRSPSVEPMRSYSVEPLRSNSVEPLRSVSVEPLVPSKGVRLVDPGNGHVPRRGSESSSVKPVIRPRRPSEAGTVMPRVAMSSTPGFVVNPAPVTPIVLGNNNPFAASAAGSAPFRRAEDHDMGKAPPSPTRHTMTLNALLGASSSSPIKSAFSSLLGGKTSPAPPPVPSLPAAPVPKSVSTHEHEDNMEVVEDSPPPVAAEAKKRSEGPAPIRPKRSARRKQQASISSFSAVSAVSAVSHNSAQSGNSSRSRGGYI